jgi:predicted DNA-binding transcriptional regulator AlpA
MMNDPTHLVDARGLAAVLSISPRQVAELSRQNAFPRIDLGHRTIRFDPSEVVKALKRHRRKGGSFASPV